MNLSLIALLMILKQLLYLVGPHRVFSSHASWDFTLRQKQQKGRDKRCKDDTFSCKSQERLFYGSGKA